ncbi:MAG TPA: hypothetical protein VGH28_03285 [Polyangiaceae bacterium]|jgi:hypothetical protein
MRSMLLVFGALITTTLSLAQCGTSPGSTFDAGPPGDAMGSPDAAFSSTFTDFGDPIFASGAPTSSQQLFGPVSNGALSGGPCLMEPEINTLYPRNWLRPRFRWIASTGENLFELRVHAPNQIKDLIVYTTDTSWTMPQTMWDHVRSDSTDMPMTLTIRGASFDGTNASGIAFGNGGNIGIAPVDAPGTIVYWYTNGYTGAIGLNAFQVGDETVTNALSTSQVQEQSTTCMGCHVGTPDGSGVVFSTENDTWGDMLADVSSGDGGVPGTVPSYAGNAGLQALLQGPLGMSAISKAHWQDGDRVVIASDNPDLQWIDVAATDPTKARGTIARVGTAAAGPIAGAPSFSHDGKTIVYTATNHAADGRLGGYIYDTDDPGSLADLYTVPYADRAGGAIAPVAGASDPLVQEYYPAFSPDDSMIAFNRIPNDKNMYNQPLSEVWLVPSSGGTAMRLAANDPPGCSGKVSPGVTNSWPKWAPNMSTTSDGRTFYWLVFSSTRAGTLPQLYITPVVVTNGKVQSYASLYLWNQPATTGNHTPAWEYFNIPPAAPPK